MSRPYSNDLRSRAVAAVEGWQNCDPLAKLFRAGVSSVIRWVDGQRWTDSFSPKPMGGNAAIGSRGSIAAWRLGRIVAEPDLTLEETRRELAERGLVVGYGKVWRFCGSEQLTLQKKDPLSLAARSPEPRSRVAFPSTARVP